MLIPNLETFAETQNSFELANIANLVTIHLASAKSMGVDLFLSSSTLMSSVKRNKKGTY